MRSFKNASLTRERIDDPRSHRYLEPGNRRVFFTCEASTNNSILQLLSDIFNVDVFTRVIITIVYLVSPDFEFCFFKSQDTANCSCFWFSLPSSTRTCCESVRLPSSVVPERKQPRYLLMIQIMIQITNNLEVDYVLLFFPLYSCMMQRLHATNISKHIFTILIQ